MTLSTWAQRRQEALRVHYTGTLSWRYVTTGERVILKRKPVCTTRGKQVKLTHHLHEVSCKRCLFFIDLAAHNNGGPLEIAS